MGLQSVKILGISITTDPKDKILEEIEKYLNFLSKLKTRNSKLAPKPLIIVTPNPEQIVYAQRDPHFAEIINQADVAIPDGIGISLAAKFLKSQNSNLNGQTIPARIPGVEFMEDLVKLASEQGYRIGLIGGRAGVALAALECLQGKYPRLQGWAVDGPEVKIQSTNLPRLPAELQIYKSTNKRNVHSVFQQYNNVAIEQFGKAAREQFFQRMAEKIRKQKTSMVFVGLGAPKQEYFIEALSRQLSARLPAGQVVRQSESGKLKAEDLPIILMSVGGSLDIISGKIPRAPSMVRKLGLEWLWRLVRQPRRLGRQLALVRFLGLVLRRRFWEKVAPRGFLACVG